MGYKRNKLSFKDFLILGLSLVFSIAAGILLNDLWFGGSILFCGLASGYLASIGRKSNYIFAFFYYLLMGYVAFKNYIFGTASFYILACVPLQIHGFINWEKNIRNGVVRTRRFTLTTSIFVVVFCLLGSCGLGYLLSLIPNERLSFLDAASNCVNVLAIFLMNLRYLESWWLSLINNIIDCLIWGIVVLSFANLSAPAMFITNFSFLLINIYAIVRWRKTSKVEKRRKTRKRML